MPDPQILNSFEELVSEMHGKIVVNERESCFLTAMRDALLPKLVSGNCESGRNCNESS